MFQTTNTFFPRICFDFIQFFPSCYRHAYKTTHSHIFWVAYLNYALDDYDYSKWKKWKNDRKSAPYLWVHLYNVNKNTDIQATFSMYTSNNNLHACKQFICSIAYIGFYESRPPAAIRLLSLIYPGRLLPFTNTHMTGKKVLDHFNTTILCVFAM